MPFETGQQSILLVNGDDLGTYFRTAELEQMAISHDMTTRGNDDVRRFAGLADGRLSMDGLFDAAADAILHPLLGAAVDPVITHGLGGGDDKFATGGEDNVRTCQGKEVNYRISDPVGDMISAGLTVEPHDGFEYGKILHKLGSESITGNSASGLDNTVATSFGGVGVLHCTVAAATSLIVKIQDSPNDSTWADIITFATITAKGGERKATATFGSTVDRYLRVLWTIVGGPFTFHVNFARRFRNL